MKRLIVWSIYLSLLLLGTANTFYAQSADTASCAVLDQQIIGQAKVFYAGAAKVFYAGALGEEVTTNNWDIETTTILYDLQYAVAGTDPVAIIIVDDFTSDDPRESEDDDVTWENSTHGWLVVDIFERIMATVPPDTAELITIEIVDMGGENEYRSDLIVANLQSVLDSLNASGIQKFVINMSFVFVACETPSFSHANWIERRKTNPELTLIEETGGDREYVETVLSDKRVTRMDERGFDIDNSRGGQGGPPERVAQKLEFLKLFEVSSMNNDPLRKFFMAKHPYTIVPVASSGNFKWKRPFFPAQWPEVLSVSATLGDATDLWELSNNAEVSAPGAYFYFDDDFYRAGTSFAAPVVSIMEAIDLTQGNPTCTLARNGRPELGSNGQWRDMYLLEAVVQRC